MTRAWTRLVALMFARRSTGGRPRCRSGFASPACAAVKVARATEYGDAVLTTDQYIPCEVIDEEWGKALVLSGVDANVVALVV